MYNDEKSTNQREMTKSLNFELVFDELAGEIVGQLKEYNLPEEGIAYVKEMLYFTVPGGINYEF